MLGGMSIAISDLRGKGSTDRLENHFRAHYSELLGGSVQGPLTAKQTKQNRAGRRIDGLQPIFYRFTAAPIEYEREMASYRARADLLIVSIKHVNVVLMSAHGASPMRYKPLLVSTSPH